MRYSTGRVAFPRRDNPPPWRGDYADIRDRVRRTGRLDVDQLWEDTESGDGYKAFWRRHGHSLFEGTWREQVDKEAAKNKELALRQYEWNKPENVSARQAAARAAADARYEAEQEAKRQRQIAKQKAADEEWARTEAEQAAAREWWTSINPKYAQGKYYPCRFAQPMTIGEVTLEPHQGYWLPAAVRKAFLKELGLG